MLNNEEQLETLFNAIPNFVLFKDKEGRWLKVNQSGKNRFKLQDFHYKGKTTSEIAEQFPVFKQDSFMSDESDEIVWRSKDSFSFEMRLQMPDQSDCWVEFTKVPVFESQERKEGRKGMLVIAKEITEQKRNVQMLEMSAKVYQYIRDGVIIADEQARIQSVNNSFTAYTGYRPEEVAGQHLCFCCSHIHEKAFFEAMWATIEETGYWQGDIWSQRKNGELFCKRLTLSSITDNKGRITNYLGIFRDITEQDKILGDIMKTAEIQRKLLPAPIVNQWVHMETVYEPKRYISGDFYDYMLSEDRRKLSGFMMDFMGHGLSTAIQASAVRVLFQQMDHLHTPLCKRVEQLNRELYTIFDDGTFAAAIFFEFDFGQMTLAITAAGINHFFRKSKAAGQIVKTEGAFLGIMEHAGFGQLSIPIHQDDYFLFLSDGFLDGMCNEFQLENLEEQGFRGAVAALRGMLRVQMRKDDCSAVCIQVK